eukprot:5414347-Pleurochrysis_carterae.AAC.1
MGEVGRESWTVLWKEHPLHVVHGPRPSCFQAPHPRLSPILPPSLCSGAPAAHPDSARGGGLAALPLRPRRGEALLAKPRCRFARDQLRRHQGARHRALGAARA